MAAKKTTKKKARKTKAKREPAEVPTLTALARRLGRDRKTVAAWRRREGFPCPFDGPYHVQRIDRWAAKWRSASANRSDTAVDAPTHPNGLTSVKPLSRERAAADLEFRQLKIEAERLKNRQLAGDLVPRSELIDLLVRRATELRRNLAVVPRNVTNDKKLQGRIRDELEAALREYVRVPE